MAFSSTMALRTTRGPFSAAHVQRCSVPVAARRHLRSARVTMMAAATPATPRALREGAVVEVALSANRRRIAVAQRADGKRNWIVVDALGVATSVAPKQVTYHVGDIESIGDLASFEADVAAALAGAADLLGVAWELVDGDVSATDVADVVFGAADVRACYVAHCMLQQDRIFFKKKAIRGVFVYEPRAPALVEEARAAQEMARRKDEEERKKRDAVRGSVDERDVKKARAALGDERFDAIVNALVAFASDANGYAGDMKADAAFQALSTADREAVRFIATAIERPASAATAFLVLVAWGVFVPHENVFLRSLGLYGDLAHQPALVEIAEQLLGHMPADVDEATRLDLSHLESFAIDSEDTIEVDDALSWDEENGIVWVHIADPTRYLSGGADNPLTQEALRRVSTLYLPTGKYTMFPESVAKRMFSLAGDEADGCALSFGFRVLEDGDIDEDDLRVVCSKIRKPTCITYDQADEMLKAGSSPLLQTLHEKAQSRLEFRKAEGAIVANRPFCLLKVIDANAQTPDVTIEVQDPDTDAWTLVSELMISACCVAGLFAEDNDVAVIFRGQSPFPLPPDDVIKSVPDGPARNALLFRNAGPSSTGLEPMAHASLGVDAYVQVTSPIRRASDLVAHMQLKAHLRGADPPLGADALRTEIARDASRGRLLRVAENKTTRYWQLEYLRRMPRDTVHDGVVVKKWNDDKLAFVQLVQFSFDLLLPVPTSIKPGDLVSLTLNNIDPMGGFTRGFVRARTEGSSELEATLDEILSDIESLDSVP